MPQVATLTQTHAKRKLRTWHYAVAIPVAFAAGGGIWTVAVNRAARSRLDHELAALRVLGVPTTPKEMRQNVDPARNAASDYRLAKAAAKRIGKKPPLRPPGATAVDDLGYVDSPDYRIWVMSQSEVLAHVEDAVQKPYCDFERDWSLGLKVLLPEFADMKGYVRMAVAKARYASESHDYPATFHWLDVGRRIAVHAREPNLIGGLVSVACENIVLTELQRQIGAHGEDPSFRKRADAFLNDLGPLASLSYSLSGEVVLLHLNLQHIEDGSLKVHDYLAILGGASFPAGLPADLWLRSFKLPGVRLDAETKILNGYRRAIQTMKRNPSDLKSIVDGARMLAPADPSVDRSLSGVMAHVFAPKLDQVSEAFVKSETLRRLSRCGLELYEIKSKSGSFPSALPSNEAWSSDPFTGLPLAYKPGKGAFILYSVGPNQFDDGGKPRFQTPTGPTDDIEFFSPRPK